MATRERSTVRFEPRVSYIGDRLATEPSRSSTKFLETPKASSLPSSCGSHRRPRKHQYIPHLHRQTTQVVPETAIGSALRRFSQTCLPEEFSVQRRAAALEEVKSIIDMIFPSLSRNLIGLRFLAPIYPLGFSHWEVEPERKVVCYLPIRLPKLEVLSKTDNHSWLQLPLKFPDSMNIETASLATQHDGFCYLSAKKFYTLLLKMLRRILLKKSFVLEDLHFSASRQILEVLLHQTEGWVVEIVPCVVTHSGNIAYCCKPFNMDSFSNANEIQYLESKTAEPLPRGDGKVILEMCDNLSGSLLSANSHDFDEKNLPPFHPTTIISSDAKTGVDEKTPKNYVASPPPPPSSSSEESSDICWYPCNPHSENIVMNTLSRTDQGVRMSAMMTVCKLARHDWRLLQLGCYQVQTAMLRDAEHQVDSSPRWQRDSLESCVRSLLSGLSTLASGDGGLPHFSVSHVDLWGAWSDKRMAMVKSALARLASSDTALASLLARAGTASLPRPLPSTDTSDGPHLVPG